ncbi:MAG: hypothetical protein IT379_13155 [Deltaproteobacteria bacterium]|nr:hypothetical protein [Deltaproteobacteria bacterium]
MADTAGSEMDLAHSQMSQAREENARHRAAAEASATLDGMMADVRTHDARMGEIARGIGSSVDRMSHCGMGMSRMRGVIVDMDAAMSRHSVEMAGLESSGDGRAECDRHFAGLEGMLDEMDDALDAMSGCGH